MPGWPLRLSGAGVPADESSVERRQYEAACWQSCHHAANAISAAGFERPSSRLRFGERIAGAAAAFSVAHENAAFDELQEVT